MKIIVNVECEIEMSFDKVVDSEGYPTDALYDEIRQNLAHADKVDFSFKRNTEEEIGVIEISTILDDDDKGEVEDEEEIEDDDEM